MSQRGDELVGQAEMLLKLFGKPSAQKAHLLAIEKELKSEGAGDSKLYREIEALCYDDASAPADYRCQYHVQEPLDQLLISERVFDLSN